MKIICAACNYAQYNKENNISLLHKRPVIYTKPDSAILKDGKPFFLPDFSEDIRANSALVLRVCRLGKNIARRFASRYYDAMTVGVDFRAFDLIEQAKRDGQPYALYDGFDGSAVLGDFVSVESLACGESNIGFTLTKNGETIQTASLTDMIYSFDELIEYISCFYTLKIGDLIYTGFPSSDFKIAIDDRLQGTVNGRDVLDFYVR